MTIAAGFVCPRGLVLCADTQETHGAIKYRVPKLVIRPLGPAEETDRKLIMAGAGDAMFIDRLVDLSWQAMNRAEPNIEAVAAGIRQALHDEHRFLRGCYHPGEFPAAELLFGLWVKNCGVRMYASSGSIMNPITENWCIGIGEVLARHIIDRMYVSDIPLELAEVLASYMLSHVKEYVDGCGGDSMIAAIDLEGNVRDLDKTTEQFISTAARNTDLFIPQLALRALVPDEEFEQALAAFCESLRDVRAKGYITQRLVSLLQGLDAAGFRNLREQLTVPQSSEEKQN